MPTPAAAFTPACRAVIGTTVETALSSDTVKDAAAPFWRNPQFISLLCGNTSLFFGYAGTMLIRSILAWQLTGDEMALAYINLASAVCIVTGSLFSGTAVDRFERRRLMIIAHSVVLVAESIGLMLFVSDRLQYHHLMLITIAMSLSFTLTTPSRTAIMVDTVGTGLLTKAMAAMASGSSLARMLSPAIAGLLAEIYGISGAYIFLVALYAAALISVLTLQPSRSAKVSQSHFLVDMRQGFSYVFNHRPMAMCLLFGLLPTMVVVPLQNLLVIFADQVWATGSSGLGVLLAMLGLGGLLGSALLMRAKHNHLALPMLANTLLLATFMILFSQSPVFWLAAIFLLAVSSFSVYTQTLVQTATQMMCSNEMRGRVSTFNMICIGLSPAGTVPMALAVKQIGAPATVTLAGVVIAALALLVWYFSASFKLIDEAANSGLDDIQPVTEEQPL